MSARPPVPRRLEVAAVSALFDDPADVDAALIRLIRAGVPRDLIDVVVGPEAAARYYPRRARRPGREALRYAGIGGLVGLIIGAALSLLLLALPGFGAPGPMSLIQLPRAQPRHDHRRRRRRADRTLPPPTHRAPARTGRGGARPDRGGRHRAHHGGGPAYRHAAG